jgi:hypothetical protein
MILRQQRIVEADNKLSMTQGEGSRLVWYGTIIAIFLLVRNVSRLFPIRFQSVLALPLRPETKPRSFSLKHCLLVTLPLLIYSSTWHIIDVHVISIISPQPERDVLILLRAISTTKLCFFLCFPFDPVPSHHIHLPARASSPIALPF